MWDATTWAAVVSAGISTVGMFGSLVAWSLARRDAKRDTVERKAEAQETARRLSELVAAAQEHVERAGTLVSSAEVQAAAAHRSAEGVESIAQTLAPSRFTLRWLSRSRFVLRNNSPSVMTIESFGNEAQFVELPFSVPVKIEGNESIQGTAFTAHGVTFPDELVLDLVGEDAPIVVPADDRPSKGWRA